ncbi:hypothetical protein U737_07690 [Methylomonas sp. LW13]|uniref:hypothetical protein n=1 Tax=unclassified Methylomonas TaxID=2608980 RepID=UPI00051BCEF7|nr:hypothetical protein [Methylomonas sp. LW13]QBC26791.1 hypothetical protein U737_07690 [Methylomonas sp. LW13]
MSIKQRVAKLENQQPQVGGWVRIIVGVGESEATANAKWLADNTDEPLPENIIYRVIVEA